MRVLELFKGSGSITRALEPLGHEIVSLDLNPKFQPTHVVDILDFEYKQYPPKHFDVIWASPECKIYSQLQTTNVGTNRKFKTREDLDAARQEHSKYVEKVLEIIEYFKPKEWYIENPYYSAMRDLECMQGLGSYRFDYCRFGFLYQKPTRIWTNRTDLEDHKCTCFKWKHPFNIGISSPEKLTIGSKPDKTKTKRRYAVPEALLRYLFQHEK